MERLSDIFTPLAGYLGEYGIVLCALFAAALILQTYYICTLYAGVVRRSKAALRSGGEEAAAGVPVSVVVPLFTEDAAGLEECFARLLTQQYGDYEVVAVYVGNDFDFYETLKHFAVRHPRLHPAHIDCSPLYPVTNKTALNVGIKEARHEHVVITTADSLPAGPHWLAALAEGFGRGDIVTGYCGVARTRGLWNTLARLYRLRESLMWAASSLVRGRSFGASRHNMGFTKTLYFGVRGFSHLNMNMGEDDLFVQRVAGKGRGNAAVVLTPEAASTERCWDGKAHLYEQIRRLHTVLRCYKPADRAFMHTELLSRTLFFATAAAAAATMPLPVAVAAGTLAALRSAAVCWGMSAVCRLTGESDLPWRNIIFDLAEPIIRPAIFTASHKYRKKWR